MTIRSARVGVQPVMAITDDWRNVLAIGLVTGCLAAGCSLPDGMNNDCEWPAEPAIPLDLNVRADAAHLRRDVKAAEELGVRYADSRLVRGRPHQGQPPTRDECDAALFRDIAALHSLDLQAVLDARERLNSERPEVVVYIPLLLLYAGISFMVARRIAVRFNWPDEKRAVLVAAALASVCLGTALVGSGHLWGGLVEMARMGNTHMTYRADRLGWKEVGPAIFVAGLAIFWASVVVHYRTLPSSTAADRDVSTV